MEVLLSGPLAKLGRGGTHSWQSRYFVLLRDVPVLAYWKSEEAFLQTRRQNAASSTELFAASGLIPLDSVDGVISLDQAKRDAERKFVVKMRGHSVAEGYRLRADSSEARDAWVSALSAEIARLRAPKPEAEAEAAAPPPPPRRRSSLMQTLSTLERRGPGLARDNSLVLDLESDAESDPEGDAPEGDAPEGRARAWALTGGDGAAPPLPQPLPLPDLSTLALATVTEDDDDDDDQVAGTHWFFIDEADQRQGPFTPEQMQEWHDVGYFAADLRVGCSTDPEPGDALALQPLMHLFADGAVRFRARAGQAMRDEDRFFYVDDEERVQGPFHRQSILVWADAGLLEATRSVAVVPAGAPADAQPQQEDFVPLSAIDLQQELPPRREAVVPRRAARRRSSAAASAGGAAASAGARARAALLEAAAATGVGRLLAPRLARVSEERFLAAMTLSEFSAGDVVVAEGAPAHELLLPSRGAFSGPLPTTAEALLHPVPAPATVTALESGALWVLSRAAFQALLAEDARREHGEVEAALSALPQLQHLGPAAMHALVDAAELRTCVASEPVVAAAGDELSACFVVASGALALSDGRSLERGDAVGLAVLVELEPQPAEAAAAAGADGAELVVVSRDAFAHAVGSLQEHALAAWQEESESEGEDEEDDWDWAAQELPGADLRIEDFRVVTALGRGAFASVSKVLHEPTGQLFALKSTRRRRMDEHGWADMVVGEARALRELVPEPAATTLVQAWVTPRHVHLLLELCAGGELHTLLHRRRVADASGRVVGSGLDADAVRFYTAVTLRGLHRLHARHVLYRDLKPENLLLDKQGYVVLGDLGLAKKAHRTYTSCGTPEYMAPEVVLSRGATRAADYWALGCVLFELLCGYSPFDGGAALETYENVLAHETDDDLEFANDDVPADARALCCALLRPDASQRLRRAAHVYEHPFLAAVDWPAIDARKQLAPYRPLRVPPPCPDDVAGLVRVVSLDESEGDGDECEPVSLW